MSSTMSTSPLRLIASSSSQPGESERYTSAELMERLQEIDLPVRRRSAPQRAAFYPAQNDNAPSAQPGHVSSFETTDANGHHQTIGCHNMDFMDLPPRAELDDITGQPKLLFSDVLHTNYQAGTAMPKKPWPTVPDLSHEKQMECAVYAVNAPIYINRARQQANRTSPALPSFPNFSGVHCSPSSSTTTAADIPTVSVPRRSLAMSHDGCAASTCSCCVTCSTCPTLPSPPASASGRSSRMRSHRVLVATWAHRREANSPPAPAVQPVNELTFSRRPVPSVQQQRQGLISYLLHAVRQDMLRGNSNNSSSQRVSFALLPQRPRHQRPLALPLLRPLHERQRRLLPENGLTASETAALHAVVDGLSQHGIIANDDSSPITPSPTTTPPTPMATTPTPTIPYPPTHPLFSTFAGLTSPFSSFSSSSASLEHSSQHSSSSPSPSRSSIPPPTPPHGHGHRKFKHATQTQTQRADSVMEISTSNTSNTSSVSELDQHQDQGHTHAAQFQRLFGAGMRVEDLPGAFSSCESDGDCEVGFECEEEDEGRSI